MTDLNQYMQDGASNQARSLLAAIQCSCPHKWFVTRWDNGREQGYTIYKAKWNPQRQLNISFAECRNSDNIVVYTWEKATFNAPTLMDINDPVSQSGWMEHTSKLFNYLDIKEAAEYITGLMSLFDPEDFA